MPLCAVGLIHAKKMFCMQCDNAFQKSKARNKNAIIHFPSADQRAQPTNFTSLLHYD